MHNIWDSCPYYVNTPEYELNSMCTACNMYPCPCCVNTNPNSDEYEGISEFISTLRKRGFIVQEGQLIYLDILRLASEGKTDTAFGNNAGAPYATYLLPPAPNQDPAPGQKPPKGYNPDDPNNYPANINYATPGTYYKLRPDEAIVLIGKTPPPAYYFSYRSYLGFVQNKPAKDYRDAITTGNKYTGYYHYIGASLGDQINNYRIWTDATPCGAPGYPFNSSTIIITTADMGINREMRDALMESGFSPDIMNNDNIPADLVNIGLEKGKDTFIFIMRAAIWADNHIGWHYINNLQDYVKVFRITPKTPYPSLNPWPVPSFESKETCTTEFQVVPNARKKLDYLRKQIINKYGNSEYDHVELDLNLWILDGYEGILQDVPVFYDNRDGTYLKTDNFQLTTDDDFVIIYGVNHTQTGRAIFLNTSFYGEKLWNGVAGANVTDELQYSADEYFPDCYKNSKYYYVVKMARKLEEGNEVIIPYKTGNPSGSAYGVNNYEDAYVGFRVYVDKETKVAPPLFDIIWSHAILFTKKKKHGCRI